jgi:hypothetical protein
LAGVAAKAQSEFDGHYVGTATLTGNDTDYAIIGEVGMTINGGTVLIREYHPQVVVRLNNFHEETERLALHEQRRELFQPVTAR